MDLFRVRLNCIDHYQASPNVFDPVLRSDVHPSQIHMEPKVPVIRVHGATETGQKVCAHIHGAFPYLYIPYEGSLNPDDVGAYIHRLHLSVDHALAISYRRNAFDGTAKFVARVTLVKGIPFYGYHVGYRFYLKIYMLNPMNMTRLADLLRQGVIMKKVFQPYEAHLQYLLQWMADYNLYGCGYIDCSKASFRSPVPKFEDIADSTHLWHDRSISTKMVTSDPTMPRVSHCSIEVDISVQDILNRKDIKSRPIHHNFIERLNPLAPDEKLVHSMAGLWKDETRRRKLKANQPILGSSPFPAEVMYSMSADPRHSQPGGWIHEDEYREKIRLLIAEECDKSDGVKVSFDSFVKTSSYSSMVRTALESVEDLYPENLREALGLSVITGTQGASDPAEHEQDAEIDENRILRMGNHDEDDLPYDSDEEVMREIELSRSKKGDKLDTMESNPGLALDDGIKLGHETHNSEHPVAGDSFASSNWGSSPDLSQSIALAAAQSQVSALARPRNMEHAGQNGNQKYSGSLPIQPRASKRQRISSDVDAVSGNDEVEFAIPSDPAESVISGAQHITRLNRVEDLPRSREPRASKRSLNGSSQEETSGSQTLKFPMVKDPHQPSSIVKAEHKESTRQGFSRIKSVSFAVLPSSQDTPCRTAKTYRPHIASSSEQPALPASTFVKRIRDTSAITDGTRLFVLNELPPTRNFVETSLQDFNVDPVIYQDAYYSNELDVPETTREWAGREFNLESLTLPFLPDFDASGSSGPLLGSKTGNPVEKLREDQAQNRRRRLCNLRSWSIAEPPPTRAEVSVWCDQDNNESTVSQTTQTKSSSKSGKLSQIEAPTQKNKHGFKYTQNQKTSGVQQEAQYMSTMSLEVHMNTRGKFVPNPEEDEIQSVFWCLKSSDLGLESNGATEGTLLGIVVLSEDETVARNIAHQVGFEVQGESSELDLLVRMVEIVRHYDPDILTGYEVHGGSWGYLIERARLKYDYDLCDELSRMKSQSHGRFGKDNDKWGFNNTSTIRVTGRHMINIWRAMRSELNLLQYTLENVAFHLLHKRVPHFAWADLTKWYTSGKPKDLAKVLSHYVLRVQLDLEILDQNELIPRTSEQARLLGIDFFSVFSRGSQYKVEAVMFRIAKPENFILVSPSRKQVGGQNALECLPLVMEPQSAFYNSPLLVLDFQSLYPSVMIAYNYCYSTFLGRIVNWRGTNKMGFTEFKRQQRLLELLKDHINVSPNGMMYTKPEIRKSLLAKMLGEILETRVMVKSGMKVDKDDKAVQRLLNNRQLALKLLANVTYGYTSASFSGRMPCSEIADSIVQTGRETLEKAIALIHSVNRWGAEVVYGDTDSIFVYLKGRTKDQAFDIGNEIASTITNMSPRPVKLKFEKVYLPCVLLAKKRYVGFKYEYKDQKEPDFDAKGIETVRRDGTPAEQKIEEKALKILFRTADLSQVKSYFQKQCEKIMKGSVSIQDFCFAREVKLGTYSDKGPPPPGALISTKKMLEDARAEPQYGERVPYVVITGAPGARLIDRCVAPEELLRNDHSELDAEYYISKNLIPPLERIFNLMGANVRNWYDEMPKVQRIRRVDVNMQLQGQSKETGANKKTLESYMKSSSCLVCREKLEAEGAICPKCLEDKPTSLLSLRQRLNRAEKTVLDIQKVCQSCSGLSPVDEVSCDSKDCPVFYTRMKHNARLRTERAVAEPVMNELVQSVRDLDW